MWISGALAKSGSEGPRPDGTQPQMDVEICGMHTSGLGMGSLTLSSWKPWRRLAAVGARRGSSSGRRRIFWMRLRMRELKTVISQKGLCKQASDVNHIVGW